MKKVFPSGHPAAVVTTQTCCSLLVGFEYNCVKIYLLFQRKFVTKVRHDDLPIEVPVIAKVERLKGKSSFLERRDICRASTALELLQRTCFIPKSEASQPKRAAQLQRLGMSKPLDSRDLRPCIGHQSSLLHDHATPRYSRDSRSRYTA